MALADFEVEVQHRVGRGVGKAVADCGVGAQVPGGVELGPGERGPGREVQGLVRGRGGWRHSAGFSGWGVLGCRRLSIRIP